MATFFKEKELLRTSGEVEPDTVLDAKIVGVYFSAGWCPPCRQFTPILADAYEEIRNKKYPFEIVFISSDKKVEHMDQYIAEDHGDWLHLSFANPFNNELRELFNVSAIPKLIILKPSGEVITNLGRKEIQDRGSLCVRSWLESAGIAFR
ncbi:nucleoredoxin-like protein 2 [Anneissia japonica]|uniref:nucleoredoxin-like protein 2 n=1 Tax=Anneissia japonica TaxID=1529436 RepID=UPI001425662D|nr:nucleoredoxin-like protein 2 [Anneissia japonica]